MDSPIPWYLPSDKSHLSLSSFLLTAVGSFITRNMVKTLEFVGLAPKGSRLVQNFLVQTAEGLVGGGKHPWPETASSKTQTPMAK
nr:cycloartenol-c-24-methyltransferase [Quercus suber]